MKLNYDCGLIEELSLMSVAIEKINKSFRLYFTKLAFNLGIKPVESKEKLSPLQVSSIAYFVLLIKGVKSGYSYEDLYTHCVLTQPMQKEYNEIINLITVFHSIQIKDLSIFQYYYEKFNSNQVTQLNLKHNLNDEIDKVKLFNTISSIFISNKAEDVNIIITIDYLLTELTMVLNYFNNLTKLLTSITKKGFSSSLEMIAIMFTPSIYKKKIGQYSNAVQVCCSNVYQSFSPKQYLIKCEYYHKEIMNVLSDFNYTALPNKIISNCYYPLENMSVLIKEKSIKLNANVRNSSSVIKEKILNYINKETLRLKNCYGRMFATLSISSDDIALELDSNVMSINKRWLKTFVDNVNNSFLHIKAKEIIDNYYLKWLQNDIMLPSIKQNEHLKAKTSSKSLKTHSVFCIERDSMSFVALKSQSEIVRSALTLGKEEENYKINDENTVISEVDIFQLDNETDQLEIKETRNNNQIALNKLLVNRETKDIGNASHLELSQMI